jgi:hypothetical protein
MTTALRQTLLIQEGGVIEIRSPELMPGFVAEVIVLMELPSNTVPSLTSLIGTAQGGFTSVAEVDEFIRQERDAWDSEAI